METVLSFVSWCLKPGGPLLRVGVQAALQRPITYLAIASVYQAPSLAAFLPTYYLNAFSPPPLC
jgi:hypothetical protein